MRAPLTLPMLHFGKLPSRGDFVRSAQAPALIQTLDKWLSAGIELLSEDPRWKLLYDRARPTQFAFLGSRAARGLVGYMIASNDAAGRRFPFIVASPIEVTEPLLFLARSPLILTRPWQRLETAARRVHTAGDATALLLDMGQAEVEWEGSVAAYDASFRDYMSVHTLGSTEALLREAGHTLSLRTLLLGLGLLLQPVPASGIQRLDKGLLLPLPKDPMARPHIAALWIDLIAGFVARGAFELAIYQHQPDANGGAVLAIGFDGTSARGLRAWIDSDCRAEVFVDATQADWVEEYVQQDWGVKKLSTYLEQSDLSLCHAAASFREAFLGS